MAGCPCGNSMRDLTGACTHCGRKRLKLCDDCGRLLSSSAGCSRKIYGKSDSSAKCCVHFFGKDLQTRGCDHCTGKRVVSGTRPQSQPGAGGGLQTSAGNPFTGQAVCNVLGCHRVTFDGNPGQCCRTCLSSSGARHGSVCQHRNRATGSDRNTSFAGPTAPRSRVCAEAACNCPLASSAGCSRKIYGKSDSSAKCCVHFFGKDLQTRGCDHCTGKRVVSGTRPQSQPGAGGGLQTSAGNPFTGQAVCNVLGCHRVTFDGNPGQCCRTCLSSSGKRHGSVCQHRNGAAASASVPACLQPVVGVCRQAGAAASQTLDQTSSALVSGILGRHQWVSDGNQKTKLHDVHQPSEEYGQVAAAFQRTFERATIRRIQRVECGALHQAFCLKLQQVKDVLGPSFEASSMVRLLFHGSEPETLQKIIHSGEGFISLLTGSRVGALFGKGTYFAATAKKASEYSSPARSGEKQMLAASVVVGLWTKGSRDMLHIPVVPGEQYRRFNSLVDSQEQPQIFVIQTTQQAYPAYLISFA